jgi:hypothetical protein
MMQQGQDVGHSQLAIFRGRNVAEMRNSLVVNLFLIFWIVSTFRSAGELSPKLECFSNYCYNFGFGKNKDFVL